LAAILTSHNRIGTVSSSQTTPLIVSPYSSAQEMIYLATPTIKEENSKRPMKFLQFWERTFQESSRQFDIVNSETKKNINEKQSYQRLEMHTFSSQIYHITLATFLF
jgi:hypothetical protein